MWKDVQAVDVAGSPVYADSACDQVSGKNQTLAIAVVILLLLKWTGPLIGAGIAYAVIKAENFFFY